MIVVFFEESVKKEDVEEILGHHVDYKIASMGIEPLDTSFCNKINVLESIKEIKAVANFKNYCLSAVRQRVIYYLAGKRDVFKKYNFSSHELSVAVSRGDSNIEVDGDHLIVSNSSEATTAYRFEIPIVELQDVDAYLTSFDLKCKKSMQEINKLQEELLNKKRALGIG